jgi:hypothetical protein
VPEPAAAPSLNLLGLNPAQIESLLGTPGAKNAEGPGQKWTYRAGDCALSISLYANVETREFRALSYEVSGNDHTEQGNHTCLAQFASRSGR